MKTQWKQLKTIKTTGSQCKCNESNKHIRKVNENEIQAMKNNEHQWKQQKVNENAVKAMKNNEKQWKH